LAEAEFWDEYRKPGTRYMGLAFACGALTVVAFYLIDAVSAGALWLGGAQTIRVVLAGACLSR